MSMVLVNGRVDAVTKQRAEQVLSEHRLTASQAIRTFFNHLAAGSPLPEFLTPPLETDAVEERRARLARLESIAGLVSSAALATDEGAAALLEAEMMQRHG
ncbi:MAG: type II toxin-antitoxin system RelB/DinJ family antitoxin [Promicromonosporaceae bacterium]|nr:type II toxin-antitoxin system RelB/DinJ family antitoxin [Promicromonosporaceae bacterium]